MNPQEYPNDLIIKEGVCCMKVFVLFFSGCECWVQEFIQNLLVPELTVHRALPSS